MPPHAGALLSHGRFLALSATGAGETVTAAGLQDVPRELHEAARYGSASALMWVLFVLILVVTGLIFRFTSGVVFYDVGPEANT
ncbi:hypothetical protein [Streptomyces sp. NPDC101455]|uniref:hypothetical protein n=1 Tax=Streptomyces sp. NPDC101455 TaxID=3366142 RepID=UPI003828194D